jgi:hypothetical protein
VKRTEGTRTPRNKKENYKENEKNADQLLRCGGVAGIFVDIKRWFLLYLYAGSGCFQAMPYLDIHGEFDYHLRYVFTGCGFERRG